MQNAYRIDACSVEFWQSAKSIQKTSAGYKIFPFIKIQAISDIVCRVHVYAFAGWGMRAGHLIRVIRYLQRLKRLSITP